MFWRRVRFRRQFLPISNCISIQVQIGLYVYQLAYNTGPYKCTCMLPGLRPVQYRVNQSFSRIVAWLQRSLHASVKQFSMHAVSASKSRTSPIQSNGGRPSFSPKAHLICTPMQYLAVNQPTQLFKTPPPPHPAQPLVPQRSPASTAGGPASGFTTLRTVCACFSASNPSMLCKAKLKLVAHAAKFFSRKCYTYRLFLAPISRLSSIGLLQIPSNFPYPQPNTRSSTGRRHREPAAVA